jgi:hypothetical protein
MSEKPHIKECVFEEGDLIHSYTRAQAIEDGVLVDVSETAREAGFKWPVAVTRVVWDGYITPDDRSRKFGQSERGRLWDVLWMLYCAIKNQRYRDNFQSSISDKRCLHYSLYFIMKEKQRRLVTLKSVSGPGDNGEPVITIMLPEED